MCDVATESEWHGVLFTVTGCTTTVVQYVISLLEFKLFCGELFSLIYYSLEEHSE